MLEKLVARVKANQPGDPLNPASRMGAIVDEKQAQGIMAFVEAGKASARLMTGGERVTVAGKGCFVQPTIFEIDHANPLARDEIFGPVLSVIPFEREDDAIAMANDTVHGLAASVWTVHRSRALRVSDRLHAGTVSVNTVDALSAQTPFGGMKQSGFGRDSSLHSFDKYTALKTTWIKFKT